MLPGYLRLCCLIGGKRREEPRSPAIEVRRFFAEFVVEEKRTSYAGKVGYSDLSPSRAPRTWPWPPEARCLRQPEKARHLCCEGTVCVTMHCPDQGPSRAPRAATEWLKRAL